MSLLMVRIDDRLIHGQVTQGWGSVLHPQRIVLANDGAAASRWEQELYEAAAPEGTKVAVLGVEEAPDRIQGWLDGEEDLLVLVESPQDALRLLEAGLEFEELNVGGMHYREGRRRILPYVCVDEEDIQAFESLREQGVRIECADVPGCERKDLFVWLGSGANGI
ncbi:MAG: PTS sugar transporter subunit IIB [bacterium]